MGREFVDRIRERLEATGKSVRGASLDADLSETALKDILSNPKQVPKISTMEKLAAALGSSPEWLAYGVGEAAVVSDKTLEAAVPANKNFGLARVDGPVQAGVFLETEAFDDDRGEMISAPKDPDFPYAAQIAYRVHGDSMDRAERPIHDGNFVICVRFADTGLEPQDGMVVVVQRTRDGGQLRERSVKELRLFDDRTEFHPRSSNTSHKPIVVQKDDAPDDGVEVEILGLVRFVFDNMPLPIGRRAVR